MDKTEQWMLGLAGIAIALWFVGLLAGMGPWIHALLLTGALLGIFDLLASRQASQRSRQR